MSREKKILYVLTNVPGSGKTTIADIIQSASKDFGHTTHYIDEFGIIGKWFGDNAKNKDLIEHKWSIGDSDEGHQELTDIAYEHLFSYTQEKIIQEFNQNSPFAHTLITEAARNIGGVSYEPLFGQLVRELGDQAKLVNLNVVVNDHDELRKRIIKRSKQFPNAASLTILNMYLEQAHLHPSSVETAARFPDHFVYNADFHNDRSPRDAAAAIQGIVGQIIASEFR